MILAILGFARYCTVIEIYIQKKIKLSISLLKCCVLCSPEHSLDVVLQFIKYRIGHQGQLAKCDREVPRDIDARLSNC